MKINKDSEQTIYNILSQIILNGTNFLLIMLFTRYLSTEHYGIVSIYQAYVLFFSVVVGLNTQGSIGTAFVHLNKENHNDYIASIFLFSLISFIIICCTTGIFIVPISEFAKLEPFLVVLILFHSLGIFSFQFLNINFVYARKAKSSCILALIVAITMIGISWLGIQYPIKAIPKYMGRILGLSLPYIICSVYAVIYIFSKGNPFRNLKCYWKLCIPICIPLVFHGFSQVVLAQTDKIMLQKLIKNNGIVGVYSFFVTFVHILNAVYTALNNTWVPLFYKYLKQRDYVLLKKRSKNYVNLFSLLVIGFILVAPEVVKIFADRNYWAGMFLIPIVAVSIYMVFLYSFAINYELYYKESKWIALGTTSSAIVNVILNSILIPKLGMYGAAMATLGAYTLLYVFHDYCAKNIIKSGEYPFNKLFFAKNTMLVLVFSVIFYILVDTWIIRWGLAVLVGIYLCYRTYKNKSIF